MSVKLVVSPEGRVRFRIRATERTLSTDTKLQQDRAAEQAKALYYLEVGRRQRNGEGSIMPLSERERRERASTTRFTGAQAVGLVDEASPHTSKLRWRLQA